MVIEVIGKDLLGVGAKFDANGINELTRLNGDKVAIAIAVEITDGAQRASGGSCQAIQHVAGVTGELV